MLGSGPGNARRVAVLALPAPARSWRRSRGRHGTGQGGRRRSSGMSGQVGGDAVDVEGVAAGGVAGASHLLDVGTLPAVAGDAREVHDRSLSVMALGVSGRTRTSGGACIAQHYRVPRVSVIFARIRSLLP